MKNLTKKLENLDYHEATQLLRNLDFTLAASVVRPEKNGYDRHTYIEIFTKDQSVVEVSVESSKCLVVSHLTLKELIEYYSKNLSDYSRAELEVYSYN